MTKEINYILDAVSTAPGFMGGNTRYTSVSGSDILYTEDICQLRNYISDLEAKINLYEQRQQLVSELSTMSDLPNIGDYVYKQEYITLNKPIAANGSYDDPEYFSPLCAAFADMVSICKYTLKKYPTQLLRFNWEILNNDLVGKPSFQMYLEEACLPESDTLGQSLDNRDHLGYVPVFEFPITFMQVTDILINSQGELSMILTADRAPSQEILPASALVSGEEFLCWKTSFKAARDKLEADLAAVLQAEGILRGQFVFTHPAELQDSPIRL